MQDNWDENNINIGIYFLKTIIMGLETLVATKHKILKAQGWITEIKIDGNEVSRTGLDIFAPIYTFKLAILRYGWGYATKNLILALELPSMPEWISKQLLADKIVEIIKNSLEAVSPKTKLASFLWKFRKKEIVILGDEELKERILKEIKI